MSATELLKTPLHALHLAQGAKMVPFAGWQMPVSYPTGVIAEHRHCRSAASLFDVSHMGQLRVRADDAAVAARALESLMPADLVGLAAGEQRYACLTNSAGGILDDLIATRRANELLLVVNASRRDADVRHLVTHIGHRCNITVLDRALLALQGPKAAAALSRLNAGVARLAFMTGDDFVLEAKGLGAGIECFVSRSGYTGEDGFEIAVAAEHADPLARALLAQPEVQLAGLGARDTLRLEAGLCLYGRDIDEGTTPVEAGLSWSIPKVRRNGGARAGGYPGAATIDTQLAHGTTNKRVGLVGLERTPVREETKIVDGHHHALGHVTSGTIGPTVDKPIAMAYLAVNHALPQHEVYALVRNQRLPMRVAPLPFVAHRYHRG